MGYFGCVSKDLLNIEIKNKRRLTFLNKFNGREWKIMIRQRIFGLARNFQSTLKLSYGTAAGIFGKYHKNYDYFGVQNVFFWF